MGEATRHALKLRREQQGFTQEGLAFAIGVSPTTYREWERGTARPRVGFRPRLAGRLDLTLAELGRMLDGDGPAEVPDGLAVPAWLGHLAALEQGASRICWFETVVAPGLLQTFDYATAVVRVAPEPFTDHEVARWVDVRMARQAVLNREPRPLELSVVLDESVLYRIAGDRAVMCGQLDHLAAMAGRPTIDLRVLPLDAGMFAFGSFILLTSPGDEQPYMACVEDRAGPHYLDRRPDVDAHIRLFDHLRHLALSAGDSLELIRAVSKERYQ